MDKRDAIEYLQSKGKIKYDVHPEFSKEEEEEIAKVQKEGKIYGDPSAEVQW